MPLLEWEKTLTCPYNPAHQITQARMALHLVKCRRNNPTADVEICPFNCSHHYPKPERQYHLDNCPDRKIVELAKYSMETEEDVGLRGEAVGQRESLGLLEEDEDWDNDPQVVSYDPQKKCEAMPVLRRLQGATPSERKKFYAAEKIRHEGLQRASVREEKKPVETSASIRRPASRADSGLNKDDFPPLSRSTITRPSGLRASLIRPGTAVVETEHPQDQARARQGSITTRLLQMVGANPINNNTVDTIESKLRKTSILE